MTSDSPYPRNRSATSSSPPGAKKPCARSQDSMRSKAPSASWSSSTSGLVAQAPDPLHERGRRSVQGALGRLAPEHRCQDARELLPELDTPLVEGVDAPDCARDEDGVLVERHEGAERERCQLLEEEDR